MEQNKLGWKYFFRSSRFKYHKKGNYVEIKRWYTFKPQEFPTNFEEQVKHLRALLLDACKIRLRSDVPVATCLSGGIDSGGILSIISKRTKSDDINQFNHKAFTMAFPRTSICEEDLAEVVAKDTGVKLDVSRLENIDIEEMENYMRSLDGFSHALAFYPIHVLYKQISRQGIKVTLDGSGPDEMLGGYDTFTEIIVSALRERKYFQIFLVLYGSILHGHEGVIKGLSRAVRIVYSLVVGKMKKWLKRGHLLENNTVSKRRIAYLMTSTYLIP